MKDGYGKVTIYFVPHGTITHKNLAVADATFRVENGTYIISGKNGSTIMIPPESVLMAIYERDQFWFKEEENCLKMYFGDKPEEDEGEDLQ